MTTYNQYTTDTILSNIELTGHVPTGNQTFTPAKLITLADRELATPILKQILSSRGGYYMTNVTLPVAQDGLYDIPSDCVAGSLYNVELIQGVTVIQVQPIEISEQFSTNTPNVTTYGYYLVGNQIQILPTPPTGDTRLWYYKRPSQLVLVEDSCLIDSVDEPNLQVTVTSIPESIHVGSTVDIVGDQPPFNILGSSVILDITGMVITLDTLPTTLPVAGNYLCLYQQTCVPQIPVEFRILLEQRTICSMYEIQKNKDGLKMSMEKLKYLESDTLGLITNRVKSKVAIINVQGAGFLGGRSQRGTFYQASKDQ
jgi:hypothetical protein